MDDYLKNICELTEKIKTVRDIIITNIVSLGEKPAPTFKEKERVEIFLDRMAEFQVDECTTDSYQTPIAIIRGKSRDKPPIFVVAHLDTFVRGDKYFNITVKENSMRWLS